MKNLLLRLPIRTKLVSGTIFTLILISLFIFIYYPSRQKELALRALENKVQSMAEMVALGVGVGLGSSNFIAISEAMKWAKKDTALAYIVVLDTTEEEFAAYNGANLKLDKHEIMNKQGIFEAEGDLHTVVPILYQNIEYGTLLLGYSLRDVNNRIHNNRITSLFISLVILLLGVTISLVFGSMITRPIMQLRDAANEVARGNWELQIKIATSDEIGVLGRAFNVMVQKINKSVTLLKEYSKELSESNQQLSKLSEAVQQSPISVLITDTCGTIEYVNPHFTQLTGYTSEEAIGKNPRLQRSGKHQPEFYQELWSTIKSGNVWRGEFCNRKKNGELYWESGCIAPIRNSEGVITHFVAVKEDITERKRAEERLQEAKRAAEAANVAKSDFLANMSHEIRTPLNAIIGMTELALETELNAEQRGFINVVQASSEGLLSLINDILDFSKIEAGQIELENIEFNLQEVVESVAEILSMRAGAKAIELLCYTEPGIPTCVVGDPTRLRQVLVNLMSNAIKFTEKGEVMVECRLWNANPKSAISNQQSAIKNSVDLHFAVHDTGLGISEENIRKIFQKFSQADTSTTRKFGGTGLGLSISKSLVGLMGGEMWVESKEGRGSTFHFRLTLPIGKAQIEAFDYAYPDFNDITILVVDDNETNRFILRKTLTAWGFQVKEAQSGPQALAILRESPAPIQLIILDQQMPDMDGPEVVKKIREKAEWAHIKVIMLASVGSIMPDLDIARCITKPVKQSKVFDILLEVLRVKNGAAVQRVKVVTPEEANTKRVQNRILLVEDNPDNQRLAQKLLQKAGYAVELAENGQLAVEAAEKFHYDLILMDIQMPVLDGFEATKEIRALERRQQEERVPIVALTAHALQGYREKCLVHDMDDYITKPIKKKVLVETIHKWLDPRPTILVVDDSLDGRNLIKNYLKRHGAYKVVFGRNGQEAVNIFKRRTISLILMDMEMPIMDGYEAASAIRELETGKDIPILALTAHQGRSEINRCLRAGCTAYIAKPIRKKKLIEVLHQYLGNVEQVCVETGQ